MGSRRTVTRSTDTTQKHYILQIITVLGNCFMEYLTKRGHFCRKISCFGSLPKPYELFRLNFLLEIHTVVTLVFETFPAPIRGGLENRFREGWRIGTERVGE